MADETQKLGAFREVDQAADNFADFSCSLHLLAWKMGRWPSKWGSSEEGFPLGLLEAAELSRIATDFPQFQALKAQ